jgi:hypothetical protein
MVGTYTDIAVRPDTAGYPLVPAQKNSDPDAANFDRILREFKSTPAKSAAAPAKTHHSFLSFIKDLIDIINPLQHIPVVSSLYRHITGDEMGPMAHFAGDALYGGPVGGALALADIAYEKTTGKDVGETVIAALTKPKTPVADTMIARNLNDISPAAGDANGIIWDDAPVVAAENSVSKNSLLSFPPTRTRTGGDEPVPPPTASPVPPQKGTIPTLQPLTASKVDSTTALQEQEAPARMARKAVPPELIASKMMDALDKYTQLKRQPAAPTVSVAY